MKILFDEISFAENTLKSGFTKYMSTNTLKILAKYYFYLGGNAETVKTDLQNFCKRFDENYNETLWEEKILNAIKYAKKEKIKIPLTVYITKSEIEKIKTIKDYKYEKVLFCLLVYSKYNKQNYEKNHNKVVENYFANITTPEILKIAKVFLTRKEQDEMNRYFQLNHFLSYNITPEEGGYVIHYADENSDVEIEINEFIDIVKYYPPYCDHCGKPLDGKVKANKKMHKKCSEEVRRIALLENNR